MTESAENLPGSLQGAWRPVAADISGSALDIAELRVARLEIEGRSYRIIDTSENAVDSGELEWIAGHAGDALHGLDIVGVDGPNAGRRMRAIYELHGDLLRVVYDLESSDRPTALAAVGDQLLLRITYQRFVLPRLNS